MALTWTTPSLPTVTVELERFADAPLVGAVKVTTPPATGSTESLGVTVTARGLANAVPAAVLCGVLPAAAVRVKPWLWKAPMSGVGVSSGSPRWSVVTPVIVVPAPRAGLPGSSATVCDGPP